MKSYYRVFTYHDEFFDFPALVNTVQFIVNARMEGAFMQEGVVVPFSEMRLVLKIQVAEPIAFMSPAGDGMTPEGRVKAEIRKWLKEQGAYVFSPVQTGMGSRTLDLLVCWQGLFVGIEVKRPGKTATRLQAIIICDIQDAGGVSFCVDSLDACKEAFADINGG